MATDGAWSVFQPVAGEETQSDRAFGISVHHLHEFFTDAHSHAQFLMEFPMQAFLKGFAFLPLAARKLPAKTAMAAERSLGDEDFAVMLDDSCRDFQDWR